MTDRELLEVMERLVAHIDEMTCRHESTHRGGVLWEICDDCGARWADDMGGKPEFTEPDYLTKARQLLKSARL